MANATLIYDPGSGSMLSGNGQEWRLITDRVMGGVSDGRLHMDRRKERDCLRMQGAVSLLNNGGFLQMALQLTGGEFFDASGYSGVHLEVAGNGEAYNVHLRTTDLRLPWQSYRAGFTSATDWRELRIPFTDFHPHRTSSSLDTSRLTRLGLVAIGREFNAELCLGRLGLYR